MAFLFKRTDKLLPSACIVLSLISIALLYSLSAMRFQYIRTHAYLVQLLTFSIGVILAFTISLFDYRKFTKLWVIYIPVSALLVALTYTSMGVTSGGNRAWLNIMDKIVFQPSELLKIAFILSFAYHLSVLGKKKMNEFSSFLLLCLHGAVPTLMVIAQADDGTALVFVFIFILMMIFAGLSIKYILAGALIIPISALLIWTKILTDNQKARFLIIFDLNSDPERYGYQQLASRNSIFSAGLLGKGLFKHNYEYVAEMDNDFIFSFAAQAMGWLGCAVITALLVFIMFRILKTGLCCNNDLGKNICVGIFALFFFQITVNILMNFGYAPVVGLPLPFLSSGGTFCVTSYILIGIALSVYSHTGKSYKRRGAK